MGLASSNEAARETRTKVCQHESGLQRSYERFAVKCPVEKEHGVRPCEIVRNVQGKTVIHICVVCLKTKETDCGEDCCPCADPEEITQFCSECNGEGEYLVCLALPHSEAQMEAYREREIPK